MSLQLVKLLDAVTITGPTGPQGIQGPAGPAGESGVVSIGQLVALELTNAPRCIYWVYGDSSDGGTTPDTSTQASIDALIAAGVSASSIRWLYETGGSLFVINPLTGGSTVDAIILTQDTGNLTPIDMSGASTIDNIVLIQNSGLLTIAELTSASFVDNIGALTGGSTLLPTDMASASTIDGDLVIVWTGGTLSPADIATASVLDNIALAFNGALFDMTSEPSGAAYYKTGDIDVYPSGNSTAIADYGRARFDFTGWQSGMSTTTVKFEFQGDDNNHTAAIRYQLKLMKKPYTEAGVYPSVTDNPLFRFIVDQRADADNAGYVMLASYRYCATSLTVYNTAELNLVNKYRLTVTLDHTNAQMMAVLYNVTTSTTIYTTAWKAIDQNVAEFQAGTVVPTTAIFEGYQFGTSGYVAPEYDAVNDRIKIIQKDGANTTHIGGITKFEVTQS